MELTVLASLICINTIFCFPRPDAHCHFNFDECPAASVLSRAQVLVLRPTFLFDRFGTIGYGYSKGSFKMLHEKKFVSFKVTDTTAWGRGFAQEDESWLSGTDVIMHPLPTPPTPTNSSILSFSLNFDSCYASACSDLLMNVIIPSCSLPILCTGSIFVRVN